MLCLQMLFDKCLFDKKTNKFFKSYDEGNFERILGIMPSLIIITYIHMHICTSASTFTKKLKKLKKQHASK